MSLETSTSQLPLSIVFVFRIADNVIYDFFLETDGYHNYLYDRKLLFINDTDSRSYRGRVYISRKLGLFTKCCP